MTKKILFISHNASRSGAPILLFNLIKLLKEESSLRAEVLIKEDGPLSKKFKKLTKTSVLYKKEKDTVQKIIRFFLRLFTKRLVGNFDLIISNTITNGNIDWLIKYYRPVFTYVHELPMVINAITTIDELQKVKAHTKLFLSPSKAITQNLITDYSINAENIKWLPYYVPDLFSEKERYRQAVRQKLGIHPKAFVVGGMGSMEWRKGIDLYFEVAKELIKTDENFFFIWCGGDEKTSQWQQYQTAVIEHSLEKNFLLIPENDQPIRFIAFYDVFFLSSREDPYPMVMVESGMMQLPVVYFKNTGGADEFIANEGGMATTAFDTKEICQHIQTLKNNVELRNDLGKKNRAKYLHLHSKEPVLKAFAQLF